MQRREEDMLIESVRKKWLRPLIFSFEFYGVLCTSASAFYPAMLGRSASTKPMYCRHRTKLSTGSRDNRHRTEDAHPVPSAERH